MYLLLIAIVLKKIHLVYKTKYKKNLLLNNRNLGIEKWNLMRDLFWAILKGTQQLKKNSFKNKSDLLNQQYVVTAYLHNHINYVFEFGKNIARVTKPYLATLQLTQYRLYIIKLMQSIWYKLSKPTFPQTK